MPGFIEIVGVYILIAVYAFYLNQMLQIRWRQWLTGHFVENWLADRAYYHISLSHGASSVVDNPDQRIADDLNAYTTSTLSLGLDFISNVVTLFSFVFVLYAISGSIKLFGVTIPGYMLYVAILYSAVGTLLTHLIGRKLVPLTFNQQRVEANFRYGLIRVRDNPEAVALYGGETDEQITPARTVPGGARQFLGDHAPDQSPEFLHHRLQPGGEYFPAPGRPAALFRA